MGDWLQFMFRLRMTVLSWTRQLTKMLLSYSCCSFIEDCQAYSRLEDWKL